MHPGCLHPTASIRKLQGRSLEPSGNISRKNGLCRPYIAPFALFLNTDNTNYVNPDICTICDKSRLTDKGCLDAPDWIIEIVSPSSKRMGYYINMFKYHTAGVREYRFDDPDKHLVLVYNFESDCTDGYTFPTL
ncbi:Uma2 family endonuclease [Lachnospiraceae bacterium 29-84]